MRFRWGRSRGNWLLGRSKRKSPEMTARAQELLFREQVAGQEEVRQVSPLGRYVLRRYPLSDLCGCRVTA